MEAAAVRTEMLEMADVAFRARNYQLAADIYECQLLELGPQRQLYLNKADALARCGRFTEAFEAYQSAADLDRLRPENLQHLLDCIAANIRVPRPQATRRLRAGPPAGSPGEQAGTGSGQEAPSDPLSCPACLELLFEPVSLPCGHTFCRRCVEEEAVSQCQLCQLPVSVRPGAGSGVSPEPNFRLNVVLCNLLEKWFASECRCRRLQLEAAGLLRSGDYSAALGVCERALFLVPHDYLIRCYRAELHVTTGKYEEALCDGDVACTLKPLKTKGHFWKAQALVKIGRTEEALKEYLYCIALRPDWNSVKLKAQKLLCDMFSPVLENMPDSRPTNLRSQSSRIGPKPTFLSTFSSASVARDGAVAGPSELFSKVNIIFTPEPNASSLILNKCKSTPGETSVTAETVPPSFTNGSRKRKISHDTEICQSFKTPSKMAKKDEFVPLPFDNFKASREISRELVDPADFECSLCMRLFYEPVTTTCGHTFCLKCLERSLDHNSDCPLCKENVAEYLVTRAFSKTFLTEELIIQYLPDELNDRRRLHEEEMKELSNLTEDVPIFVCTMSFPTIPCPLHVFEPRYRLMIRRCMETGTKQFGMCIGNELKGFADYGCMLEIRDVKFFPDGRSVVDTIGKCRFKVLRHGQRDGYNTANIEYLEDTKVEGEAYHELVCLSDSVYDQAFTWFSSLKDNMRTQILNHFGPMPGKEPIPQSSQNGPAWCWWLLAVLPLESRAQLAVLSMISLKDRLIAIRRVLVFVTRQRLRSL
ncbi:LON peptidase N-terminal domain and RING finger protein 2 isoform X1 [Scyliorhinus canicula]|uniref:LON peptidase N-terminal domain and RING finger protein 2 isoform X1 n=1 Tax=Scyliorhinus canicula TaxID=7830 RepID=UPI0018F34531|nr:LON peptidase N-terminal domain and RING finger protein 2 isoform X1 [Scyliorhinus canicula]